MKLASLTNQIFISRKNFVSRLRFWNYENYLKLDTIGKRKKRKNA